jgi:hypothetical protein
LLLRPSVGLREVRHVVPDHDEVAKYV